MADKIINLFNGDDSGIKYSELLESFISPLVDEFPEDDSLDYIYEIAISAWNIACISMTLPEKARPEVLQLAYKDFPDEPLLKTLIERKSKSYNQYDHLYRGFELKEEEDGSITLTVKSQTIQEYLLNQKDSAANMFLGPEEPGPIDRHAIVLKPKQPLFDWINGIYPEKPIFEADEANIYLINNRKAKILDSWLKKHFDRFFQMELEYWHTNKKEWPQKRTYKLFKEWFQIEVSTLVMDLENAPIFKG